jgi:hypothetical protein
VPGHGTDHGAILTDDETTGVIEAGWTHRGALASRTEVIERALTTGQHHKIVLSLGPQHDTHDLIRINADTSATIRGSSAVDGGAVLATGERGVAGDASGVCRGCERRRRDPARLSQL